MGLHIKSHALVDVLWRCQSVWSELVAHMCYGHEGIPRSADERASDFDRH